jgi:hypothetical protein
MQSVNEAAVADACLFFQAAQGSPVKIVLYGYVSEELIAVERLGEHAGRSRLESSMTVGTSLDAEVIKGHLRTNRLTIDHRAPPQAVVLKSHPAIRTRTLFDRDRLDLIGGLIAQRFSSVADMTRASASPAHLSFG